MHLNWSPLKSKLVKTDRTSLENRESIVELLFLSSIGPLINFKRFPFSHREVLPRAAGSKKIVCGRERKREGETERESEN